MNQLRRLYTPRGLLLIAALAAACGSARLGGGIAGTSSVVGAISGFGSIVVNGVAFEVDGAQVTIEEDPASVADLRLGMVAIVRGTVDPSRATGVAELVNVEDVVEGPIEAIDRAAGTLRVLAQTVLIDGATVLEPTSLDRLEIGDGVEVSGFRDADLRIRATRVQEKPASELEIELKGAIANLDPGASTFAIGALVVDFAQAVIENAPPGGLREGLFVEVEGEDAPEDDVLAAVGVEIPPPLGTAGDELDIEGFVTEVLSADELVVNATQRVRLGPDTIFEGGSRADLVPNAAVDVEGPVDESGVLLAREVELVR